MIEDQVLGCRWLLGGRDPRHGVDCFGVVLWLCQQWGHSLPDLSSLVPSSGDASGLLRPPQGWQIVQLGQEQRGSVVWLRRDALSEIVDSVGWVDQPGSIVTAIPQAGVRRLSLRRGMRERVHEIWRAPC
jgi:cell wall-associated NlpC family hydrolase